MYILNKYTIKFLFIIISSLHLKLLQNILLATQVARVAAALVTTGTNIYLWTFRITTCTSSGKTKTNRASRTFGNATKTNRAGRTFRNAATPSTTTIRHFTASSI